MNSGIRSRDRVIRLLTLISFFCFSGLNNGLTHFVVSSGKMQNVDFAPILVQELASVLNPVNWKAMIFDPVFLRRCPETARSIESLSQRAVQNILMESSLVQITLMDSCLKVIRLSGRKTSDAKVTAPPAVENVIVSGQVRTASKQSDGPAMSGEASQSRVSGSAGIVPRDGFATDSGRELLLTPGDSNCRIENQTEYLRADRRQAWLMERFHLWKGEKGRKFFLLSVPIGAMTIFGRAGPVAPVIQKVKKRYVKFAPEKGIRRICYARNAAGEDVLKLHFDGDSKISPEVPGLIFFGSEPV